MVFKTTDANTSAQRFYQGWLSLRGKVTHPWRLFSEKKPMPKNEGQTIVLRYHDALTIPTGTLAEGVVPTGSTPVLNEITITTNAYGDYVEITDSVGVFDKDGQVLQNPKSAQNVALLGEQAIKKLNTVARDAAAGGTNVYYAGTPSVTSRTQINTGNKPSVVDYRNIVRLLLLSNIEPVTPIVVAGAGQSTKPIGKAFIAIVGPRTIADVSQLPGWVNVYEYASAGSAYPDEVGALNGLAGYAIRFISTTNDKVFAAGGYDGTDVYADIIFGKEFFGETDPYNGTTQDSFEFISKAPGSAGTADPLNQKSTMGWKCAGFGCAILNELAGVRYEHASSE